MIRHCVQLLGVGLTITGILSVWATYLLTHWYHPSKAKGFLRTIVRVVSLLIQRDMARILKEAGTASRLGEVNDDTRS